MFQLFRIQMRRHFCEHILDDFFYHNKPLLYTDIVKDRGFLCQLLTQLYSDKADVSALNSYATKSELTASKNGYPGVKTIKSLSSAGQLTQAGSYHFEAITADVNKDAGTEIFSEYNMGDFYALLLGEDSNSNDGCNFGTLLIASPRINNGIWICTIWQKKMIHWYKIAKISTD